MTSDKKTFAVSALVILAFIILLRILAVKAVNYVLTPKIGQTYGRSEKILVTNDNGSISEQIEYNQVKVYDCTNDSVFYIITMYNGVNCNDSSASTIVNFSNSYQ